MAKRSAGVLLYRQEDGVLQVLIFEGAVTKRYRITPGSDTSIQTLLAGAAK